MAIKLGKIDTEHLQSDGSTITFKIAFAKRLLPLELPMVQSAFRELRTDQFSVFNITADNMSVQIGGQTMILSRYTILFSKSLIGWKPLLMQ